MQKRGSKLILSCFLGVFLTSSPSATLLHEHPPQKSIRTFKAAPDFRHHVGKKGAKGWQLDYKKHKPGYALASLYEPLLLGPGAYRISYLLRRGNYPNKGLLRKTMGIFRLEIWDLENHQAIKSREVQIGDFRHANQYEKRWIDFSIEGPETHLVEPRVYWMGLVNSEISNIEVIKFPPVDLKELQDKAERMGANLERHFLENGFVVSRKPNGDADETGDATTYTSLYAASLAWKYAVTKDALTYQSLENAIQALHTVVQGTRDHALLARYVDKDGAPHPKPPSKDVYTFFYYAYSAAFPYIKNESLREQMIEDLEHVTYTILDGDLAIQAGEHKVLSFKPYLTEDEIRHGIRKMFKKEKTAKKILSGLKKARRVMPLVELWPGMKKVIKAIKNRSENDLFEMVLPTMNGVAGLAERGHEILGEAYRQDLLPFRKRNIYHPGLRLEVELNRSLNKLPKKRGGERFKRITDLRVLAANAIISMHLLRTAEVITKNIQFEEYMRTNLYQQDALMQSALDWYGIEETFLRLTSGNPAADRDRKGYLTPMSLTNLIHLETNPTKKVTYQQLLARWAESYEHEDNPMAFAFKEVFLGDKKQNFHILRALSLYPENRTGFGSEYWKDKGQYIGETWGGGTYRKHSREPLPVSHRPKDSFLWQRNSRRLKGDYVKNYPGTDYLYLYWFCRYHNLIPNPTEIPQVSK